MMHVYADFPVALEVVILWKQCTYSEYFPLLHNDTPLLIKDHSLKGVPSKATIGKEASVYNTDPKVGGKKMD